MKSSPPLDIEAIRVRLASANPFGVPRWVASDVGYLLAEVVRLRAEVRDREARADFIKAGVEQQRRSADDALEKVRKERVAWEARVRRDRAEVVTWLRAFAAVKTVGPVSPVRRIEHTFASRAADAIERGEHVPVPATSSEESGEA